MSPIFHFQYRSECGWEAIGAAVGDGEHAAEQELEELRMLSGDALPAGEYEVIEARSSATRWVGFDLREDGSFDGSLNGV